jgi:hypothetical protein
VRLAGVQQWVQDAITNSVAPAAEDVERYITPSRRASAIERLSVYSRAYMARLQSAMRAEHPVLLHLLGRDTFDAYTAAYLHACPPRSYTLANLAIHFADWLRETAPAGEAWPELLIDLAVLERAFLEVFDGAASERREIAFRYPVVAYFHAVRGGADPPVPEPRGTRAVISRRGYDVIVEEL